MRCLLIASQLLPLHAASAPSQKPTPPPPPPPRGPTWATIPDKALHCESSEYRGSLGVMGAASLCGAAVRERADVNYAVWRGDQDKRCYICAITKRGLPSAWQYSDDVGAVSFAGAGVLPTPPSPSYPGEHHKWNGDCYACARFPEMANYSLPDLDWVLKGAMTPVKNRNGCDACGIFSAISDVESSWFLAGHPLPTLSAQELVSCAPPAGGRHSDNCHGGERYRYFSWAAEQGGIVSEASYPYSQQGMDAPPAACDAASRAAPLAANVTGWFRLTDKSDPDAEAKLLDAVRKVGPTSICMSWHHLSSYRGGIDDPGQPGSTTGTNTCPTLCDHSMIVVGYGHDVPSGLDYWKIQDSAGTSFGDEGFYRVRRGKNHCGLASYAYKSVVTPPQRFHCHAASQQCVPAFSGHDTLAKCEEACRCSDPSAPRYACDPATRQCAAHSEGFCTAAACAAACAAPTPAPPAPRWHCAEATGKCVERDAGHSTLALCRAACAPTPAPPPTPPPLAPSPAPPVRYSCHASSRRCVAQGTGHSTLQLCEEACALAPPTPAPPPPATPPPPPAPPPAPPVPPPAPPAPVPAACAAALSQDCAGLQGQDALCARCVVRHQVALRAAGCAIALGTHDDTWRWCNQQQARA